MPARRPAIALVAIVLLVALSACGGDDGEAGGSLVDPAAKTTTTKDEPSGTTTTRPAATSTSTSTPATTTTAAPPTTTQTLPDITQPPANNDHGPDAFRSPTGNIGCYINGDVARCDIAEHSWEPPPKPASCEFDWGNGIELDHDGAGFICAGDTTLGAETVLEYGSSAQRGTFYCESADTGMSCIDTSTGSGFSLSRGSYRIF
jgi:hypothetical protein